MHGLKKLWNYWLSGTTRLRSGDILLVEPPMNSAPNSQNRIENNGTSIVRGLPVIKQAAPTALTGSATLTAAQLLALLFTSVPGGAANANYTLPLATLMDAAMPPGFTPNDSFDFDIVNTSAVAAETCTIVTAAGWTLVGNMVISSNNAATLQSQGKFRARKTAAGAWTLYRIG